MATAQFLVVLIAYLFFASSLIAFVVEDAEIIRVSDLAGFENTETNFTALSNMSDINAVITAGSWNLSIIYGLYSTTPLMKNEIFFYGLNHSEGIYNNTYQIKNPHGLQHGIHIFKQTGFNSMWILVDDDGFTFRRGITTLAFYDYDDADAIAEYSITTRWNIDTGRCIVELDSVEIFDLDASKTATSAIWSLLKWDEYFSGVFVYGSGFELHSLSSLFTISVSEASFSLSDFMKTMATVIFWTLPDSLAFPLWLNILLIKIPGLGIIFILIQTIRGTG